MPQGSLEVLLVGAKDLESSGFFSKLKPYVVLKLRTQEEKSTVCKGTESTDPEWNETFQFTVSSDDVDELTLKIMDKDTFSSDDFVGEATIPLEAVFTEGSVAPASYNVINEDKEYHGEITVGLTFTPEATEEDCEAEACGHDDQQASYGNVSRGAAHVDNSSRPSHGVSSQQHCAEMGYGNTTAAAYGHDTATGYGNTGETGYGNTAPAGYGNTAAADYGNTAAAGYGNTAAAGYGNTATAGYGNTAAAGYGNTAAAGYGNTRATADYDNTGAAGYDNTGAAGYGNTAGSYGHDTGAAGYGTAANYGHDTGAAGYGTAASYGHDTRRGYGDTRDGCHDDDDDHDSRGGYGGSRGTHGTHGRRRSSRHCEEEEEEEKSYGGYRESSYRG